MTADGKNDAPVIDDDVNTTAPQSSPVAWRMPEPVFRQTSGKLPQGFEKNYAAEDSPDPDPPAADMSVGMSDSIAEPRPGSSILKIILVILGLTAMIAFIVVFLTVVYFFFLRSN